MSTVALPRWQCHKQVSAVKIEGVREGFGDGRAFSAFIVPEGGLPEIEVGQEFITKHKPVAGGYFVVYDDGYRSFSPAEAFESGYTRI